MPIAPRRSQGKGQNDEAFADANQAIALQPDLAPAFFTRGTVYNGRRQHDEAIADFARAIALRPDFAAAYEARGGAP